MSDAPEQIWAWEYKGNTPWGEQEPNLSVVTNGAKYIRADIHAARIAELEAERDALAARVKELEGALRVYADPCDATEATPCGYEGNMCCITARAAITRKEGA